MSITAFLQDAYNYTLLQGYMDSENTDWMLSEYRVVKNSCPHCGYGNFPKCKYCGKDILWRGYKGNPHGAYTVLIAKEGKFAGKYAEFPFVFYRWNNDIFIICEVVLCCCGKMNEFLISTTRTPDFLVKNKTVFSNSNSDFDTITDDCYILNDSILNDYKSKHCGTFTLKSYFKTDSENTIPENTDHRLWGRYWISAM